MLTVLQIVHGIKGIQMLCKTSYLQMRASLCSCTSSDSIYPFLFMTNAHLELRFLHLHELLMTTRNSEQWSVTCLVYQSLKQPFHFPLQVHDSLAWQTSSFFLFQSDINQALTTMPLDPTESTFNQSEKEDLWHLTSQMWTDNALLSVTVSNSPHIR